jgi:hypothetical protein
VLCKYVISGHILKKTSFVPPFSESAFCIYISRKSLEMNKDIIASESYAVTKSIMFRTQPRYHDVAVKNLTCFQIHTAHLDIIKVFFIHLLMHK